MLWAKVTSYGLVAGLGLGLASAHVAGGLMLSLFAVIATGHLLARTERS